MCLALPNKKGSSSIHFFYHQDQQDQKQNSALQSSCYNKAKTFPFKKSAKQIHICKRFNSRKNETQKIKTEPEIDMMDLKDKVKMCSTSHAPKFSSKRFPVENSVTNKKIAIQIVPDLSIRRQSLRIRSEPKTPYGKKNLVLIRKKIKDAMKNYLPICKTCPIKNQLERELPFCLTEVLQRRQDSFQKRTSQQKQSKKLKIRKLKTRKQEKKLKETEDEKLKGWQVRKTSYYCQQQQYIIN